MASAPPQVPVDGKGLDWPRRVANAINGLIGRFGKLDARVAAVEAGGASSVSTPLTLINGWVPFGSGYGAPEIVKTGRSVTVTGLIAGGSPGTTAFALPIGWRPADNQQFIQASSVSFALVDVFAATGNVQVNGYSTYVSVNMTFVVP